MTIYGEFLFAENFISGFIILVLTARLQGIAADKWRISAGAVMCGLYSFVLFLNMGWILSLFCKLAFSVVVVITSFGRSGLKTAASTTGVFYIMSFLMGGVTIAVMYCVRIPGLSANGSVYMKCLAYIQIAAGIAASWFLGKWLAELLKEKAIRKAKMRHVEIRIDENSWRFMALVDTGNFLKDPVNGRPVAVISKSAGEKIRREIGPLLQMRMCLIPYKSVGRSGLMEGIRTDMISIDEVHVERVMLAISDSDFHLMDGVEKYDILLHQQHLKGEDSYG